MFENLYIQISNKLTNYKCIGCNGNNADNKVNCLDLDLMFRYRTNGIYIEQYNCDRKALAFVKKYGASYISEIYHYLETSKILEQYKNNKLKVLALGCGFDPWYYAITKYIQQNRLNINFVYVGYDKSANWNCVRPYYANAKHNRIDLTAPLNIICNNYDIILVDKVFSTIRKMENSEKQNIFLNNITTYFKKIYSNTKHTLIFREQASEKDIFNFDFFVNKNINWKSIDYFYTKGRASYHFEKIINTYISQNKKITEICDNRIIYGKYYSNGYNKFTFNTFFIQYSI